MVGLNHELARGAAVARVPERHARAPTSAASGTRAARRARSAQLPADPRVGPGRRPRARASARAAHVVLLIRGELLHRYPDALIYAVKAKTLKALGTEEKLPLFRGRIDPDITFLGFDLTEAAGARRGQRPRLVLRDPGAADRATVRAGRDANAARSTRGTTSRGATSRPRRARTSAARRRRRRSRIPAASRWGFNGAHMAGVLRQRPVRIAIHARQLPPADQMKTLAQVETLVGAPPAGVRARSRCCRCRCRRATSRATGARSCSCASIPDELHLDCHEPSLTAAEVAVGQEGLAAGMADEARQGGRAPRLDAARGALRRAACRVDRAQAADRRT